MQVKVSTNFLNTDTDAELIVDCGRIIASMTGNASFPTPSPTLAPVGTALTNFKNAVQGLDGTQTATLTRDNTRDALCNLLRQLGLYVEGACNGDLTVLLGSGFTAEKVNRQKAGQLSSPDGLKLYRPDMSGQLKGRCSPVANAGSYKWRIALTSAPTVWLQNLVSVSAHALFENLTPGGLYVVQVCAVGAAGDSDWSDPAVLMCV
jgi:hypothetical protein